MQTFTAIIERDRGTGYYVGYVPELPGAHSQGASIEELRANLVKVFPARKTFRTPLVME